MPVDEQPYGSVKEVYTASMFRGSPPLNCLETPNDQLDTPCHYR